MSEGGSSFSNSMRILHYNILNGFGHEPKRIKAFLAYLKGRSYDIILLNEYQSRSAELADSLTAEGYCYAVVNMTAPSSNRCAIFSRIPFKNRSCSEGFRFLHIEIGELGIVSYHASPRGVESVMEEAGKLLPMIEGRCNTILAGDFNSLSPGDRMRFRYERPLGEIPARYLSGDTVSYDFIRLLEANGFIDVDDGSMLYNHTVPTGITHSEGYDFRARLDYAYARLDGSFSASSRVLQDASFDFLSDHYPLEISIA